MADPRIITDVAERIGKGKKSKLSRLLLAKAENTTGEVLNFCPFGCPDEALDDHGYCDHLVGFTNSTLQECKAGNGVMDPMVMNEAGRRVVQVPSRRVGKKEIFQQTKVLPTDVLELISISSRVYRPTEPKAIKAG